MHICMYMGFNIVFVLEVVYLSKGPFQIFQFLQCRDTCSRKDESPVYEVNTVTGHLWPVLVLELVC